MMITHFLCVVNCHYKQNLNIFLYCFLSTTLFIIGVSPRFDLLCINHCILFILSAYLCIIIHRDLNDVVCSQSSQEKVPKLDRVQWNSNFDGCWWAFCESWWASWVEILEICSRITPLSWLVSSDRVFVRWFLPRRLPSVASKLRGISSYLCVTVGQPAAVTKYVFISMFYDNCLVAFATPAAS